MAAIQVNNTQLEYIEQGQGAPVVLVDGSLGDYRGWGLQMDALAKSYRTISYSRRYHYPNECSGNETNYSTVLHAEDLSALISGLGLDPPHLAGTSYGAYTASFMAMNHPTQVRSLVLSEPPVFNLIEQNQKGRAMRNEFLDNVWEPAKKLMQLGKMENGVKVFVDGMVGEGVFDQFPPEVKQLIMDNACEFKS